MYILSINLEQFYVISDQFIPALHLILVQKFDYSLLNLLFLITLHFSYHDTVKFLVYMYMHSATSVIQERI